MKRITVFVCLVGIFILWGFGRNVQGADVTLRLAGNTPLDHHLTRGLDLYAKGIEKHSGSKIKVQTYPAGQLFSDKDMMKAVPSGAVDGGVINISQWTGLCPGVMVLDLPLFFKDWNHIYRTVDGDAGKMMIKDFEKVGVKFLYWDDFAWAEFASKIPLKKLEDFKGKRIRGYGELITDSIKALGGAPTFLGGGEVYMALQRGTVDAAVSGTPSFYERKYYEVTKYLTLSQYSFIMFGMVMNLKKWNALGPDLQKAVTQASQEAQDWARKEAQKVGAESADLLKNKGMDVYQLPKAERERWAKASEPVFDRFLKRAGGEGRTLYELAKKVQ